jgi:predicted nucleic acid-binding Zn ribbon protein
MAKRPLANPNNRARRRMRIQSLLFTLLGLLVVASFVLSLIQ